MTFKDTLNRSSRSLSEFLDARNARERRMLALGTTAILIAVLYLLLLAPAIDGRIQLSKSLPVMRQEVAQLQNLSREAVGLAGQKAPAVTPLSKESLEASLARAGLTAQNISVSADSARLQLPSASFSGLLAWLDEMQKSSLTSVAEANIIALGQPDMVNATLTLRQTKSE